MSISKGLFDSLESLSKAVPNIKGMIYGESGVGKTVLGLQLAQRCNAEDKDILYIDAVEGWVSLRNHEGTLKNVLRMSYQGLSQLDATAEFISLHKEPFNNVGTIVLDEMSSIAKLDLDNVLKVRAAKDPGKDSEVPTQPDYLANTERTRRTMLRIMKLPINIIVLSHLKNDTDETTGILSVRPSLTPKFSETLREMLHFVVHMTADNEVKAGVEKYTRRLQLNPTKKVIAKNRIGGMTTFSTPEAFIDGVVEWLAKGGGFNTEPESKTTKPAETPKLIELN